MRLYLDENNKITGFARIGGRAPNSYEVDSVPDEVLENILNYKYINGEFIKIDENPRNNYIDIVRDVKINVMSSMCASMINNGIDFNGEHYSLTTTDQINLMKLESVARFSPETPILYHADGKECRQYSAEEIIQIATLGIGLITFHTTYFNQLKAQIKLMTDIDDIIGVKYGMKLDEVHDAQFKLLTNGIEFPLSEIDDMFDYETLIPKTDPESVRAALKPVVEPEKVTNNGPIIEPWKPSTQPFVREDELIIEPYEPSDDFPVDEPVDEEPPTDVESGEPYENEDTPTDGEAE